MKMISSDVRRMLSGVKVQNKMYRAFVAMETDIYFQPP